MLCVVVSVVGCCERAVELSGCSELNWHSSGVGVVGAVIRRIEGHPRHPETVRGHGYPSTHDRATHECLLLSSSLCLWLGSSAPHAACGVRFGAPCADVGGCRRSVLIFL